QQRKERKLSVGRGRITPRTGRVAARASRPSGGTPAPKEKQTEAAQALGASTARQWPPLLRAAVGAYRVAPGPAAGPAVRPGCAAHGRAHRLRRVRASERSSPQT